MRNRAILALVTFLCLGVFTADPAAALLPSFGVKAGVNSAGVSSEDLADSGSRTGFVGGGWARLDLVGLSLQGELLYSQKGYREGRIGSDGGYEGDLDYFDVPVFARLGLPLPMVTPFAYLGGQVGFLTAAQTRGPDTGGEWVDGKEGGTDTVWAIVLGVGAGLGQFHGDIRYTHGLTNLVEGESDLKDRTWSVTIGYALF
jgi:hypothetical protein